MANKNALNKLILNYSVEALESHFFYSYLREQQINFSKSKIILKYFSDFNPNFDLIEQISKLEIQNIKELENYLELLIPKNDRKLNGAFFTPDYIVSFIINEVNPEENHQNLDPSCGCGAFLIGLTEYYKIKFQKPIRKIVKENIFGSDILEYNVHRSKLLLTVYALQYDEYLTESDFNIYHQDSLKAEWKRQFDNIIGNPPYVKFQDLSNENRDYLTSHWSTVEGGTFNLYFAFFELGFKLLKPTGKLGYITPNNYFTSLSGESLRKYFHNKKCVNRIIDFSHKKVFDAQTYTALTFLNKLDNESITFDRIKDGYEPEHFLQNANGSINYLKDLNSKKWRLLKSDEQQNIKNIETIGLPIGKLFNICVGIATLKDEIFFLDEKERRGNFYIKSTDKGQFQIEKEIVKSVFKISDFKNQDEVEHNTRRIICPYKIGDSNATPLSEREFRSKYPKAYEYFLSEKNNLLARDKGKVNFEPFFVWGRTQGLTRTGIKILNPTFSQRPRFLLINDREAFFTNGYGLYFRAEDENSMFSELANPIAKSENIDVVQKILNSIVMEYYVGKTSVSIEGGYPCYQKNFIEKFTIPFLTEKEIKFLRKTSSKIETDDFLVAKYQLKVLAGNLSL